MTLLEDFPSFTLWHDLPSTCLCAVWQGYHDSLLTKVQYTLIQKHVRETGSTKLLNDSLQDEDGWDQVTDWLADTCFERLADNGLQAVAWVLPRHPSALYDTARVLARLRRPTVDTFLDAQAAYDWLQRWPFSASPRGGATMAAVEFLLLPLPEQLILIRQIGQALPTHWEIEFYIESYLLWGTLLVEVYYHLHSGVFYQIKANLKE